MQAIKGVYQNGEVRLLERPTIQGTSEVIIVFPDKTKKISKIGGLFKNHAINFSAVEEELKNLNRQSQKHLLEEAGEGK